MTRKRILGFSVLVASAVPAPGRAQECGVWGLREPGGERPSPRNDHVMTYDCARGETLLFGGRNGDFFGDTWAWNGTSWSKKRDLVPGLEVRLNAGMAFDSRREVAVLFGGGDQGHNGYDDTWEWNGEGWTFRMSGGPPPRAAHAMTYHEARGLTVLFGGAGPDGYCPNDTWTWDGFSWSQPPSPGDVPSPRLGHAMAYDSRRGVIVLYGGRTENGVSAETYEWDGSWSKKCDACPPGQLQDHAMAFDSSRGETVLFGGYGSDLNAKTWEWDGGRWRLCSDAPAKYAHDMAYDSARCEAVLFGGFNGATLGDTWEYGLDRDGEPGPDDCEGSRGCHPPLCDSINRFNMHISDRGGRCRIKTTVRTSLPEGTVLHFCLNDEQPCEEVEINARGMGRKSWIRQEQGNYRVCIEECPAVCRERPCSPEP